MTERLPEDYGNPEKPPYPVKKVTEVFLEEGVIELCWDLGGGETAGSALEAEEQRKSKKQARPTMEGLLSYTFGLCLETKFPKKA